MTKIICSRCGKTMKPLITKNMTAKYIRFQCPNGHITVRSKEELEKAKIEEKRLKSLNDALKSIW